MPKGMTTDSQNRRRGGASHFRDVSPTEMASLLRSMLGLDPHEQQPEERAADLRRQFPKYVNGVNSGAWIAWCLVGLALFAGLRLPTMRAVVATARRVIVALAMMQTGGNLSHAAVRLMVSRRALRQALKDYELYPWVRGLDDRNGPPVVTIGAKLPEVEETQEIPRLRFVQPAKYGLEVPPEVVEDGIAGTVEFRVENEAEGAGPAWLVRGDRREPLFRGMWCDAATARAYARSHGHAFEEIDGDE